MAELEDAVRLVTDPQNLTPLRASGPRGRVFAVKTRRVIRALRDLGAGKAEARQLALEAVEQVGGGVEQHAGRAPGGAAKRGDDPTLEDWWVPAEAVRFDAAAPAGGGSEEGESSG